MNIGIWKEEEKPEPKVLLRLRPHYKGGVKIVAVDSKGNILSSGNLLYFEPDGTIRRARSVGRDFSFQLDRSGSIKLKGEKKDC